jgi:glutamate-1-semialdehyde 2,1-aminomutase
MERDDSGGHNCTIAAFLPFTALAKTACIRAQAYSQGMTAALTPRQQLIADLTRQEFSVFEQRTPRSKAATQNAVEVMPLGAPTNVCSLYPYPLHIERGQGVTLTDIDGNEYIDFGLGYGSLPFGHANPHVIKAAYEQMQKGTHFGAVTGAVVDYAEHLCHRFGLNWVRFSASGTEATMDAIRLARAKTRRNFVIKFEGAYHGAHADTFISINQDLTPQMGSDEHPVGVITDDSFPASVTENVRIVPFNDLQAVEAALALDDVACLIAEPVMYNVGAIEPGADGARRPTREQGAAYLQGLRDLCDRYGALLIFDEVKTGATIAYGGASEYYGVTPHIKTFAKTIAGGFHGGAFGDTDGSTFETIEQSDMFHVGTLSGNPITAAAGLAALHVLDYPAYDTIEGFGQYLEQGLQRIINEYKLPAYIVRQGAKSCIVWSDVQLSNFRNYSRHFDNDISMLCWAFMVNRGIFFSHGGDEQMTFSVYHKQEHAEKFLDVFEEFAQLLNEQGLV